MAIPPPQNVAYPRGASGATLESFRELMAAYDKSNQVVYMFLGLVVLELATHFLPTNIFRVAMLVPYAGYLAFTVFAVMASRTAAKAVGTNIGLATITAVIAMCVPCGALILVIGMQQRILGKLKPYGIKPGISGVTKKKRAEVESRLLAEAGPVDMSKPPTMG